MATQPGSAPSPPPTSEAGPAPLDFGPGDIKAHVGTAAGQLSFRARAATGRSQLSLQPILLHGTQVLRPREGGIWGISWKWPPAYKSDVLGGDIVVDAVSHPVVGGPAALGVALAGAGGVVTDEASALHQEVKDEARQLHADGDEEEDDRVLLLIRQQQLGEDAAERDDDPGGAWWHRSAAGAGSH